MGFGKWLLLGVATFLFNISVAGTWFLLYN